MHPFNGPFSGTTWVSRYQIVKTNLDFMQQEIVNGSGTSWTSIQYKHTHTHTHPFNGPFSRTTEVSRYHKGKTNLDFTEAREWVAVVSAGPYASLHLAPDTWPCQHPTTQFFLQAGCPSCHPTNSIKALKAQYKQENNIYSIKIKKSNQGSITPQSTQRAHTDKETEDRTPAH